MRAIKKFLTRISPKTQKVIQIYISLEQLDEKFELSPDLYQLSAKGFFDLFQKMQDTIFSTSTKNN